MAYNDTAKKINTAAANDTAQKLKQETSISKDLRKYFKLVTTEFAILYAREGKLINMASYQSILQDILGKHYADTANVFKSQIRDELGNPNKDAEAIAADINDTLFQEGLFFVPQSTKHISTTTEKVLNKHIKNTVADAAATGIILNSRQVAKKVKNPFLEEMNKRADGVDAVTQTNFPAEVGKHTEINSLVKLGAAIGTLNMAKSKNNKHWFTIVDGKERLSHLEANGQKQPINQPYLVQGQKLRHPGDTSLGATIDNVANCRCSSIIIIK